MEPEHSSCLFLDFEAWSTKIILIQRRSAAENKRSNRTFLQVVEENTCKIIEQRSYDIPLAWRGGRNCASNVKARSWRYRQNFGEKQSRISVTENTNRQSCAKQMYAPAAEVRLQTLTVHVENNSTSFLKQKRKTVRVGTLHFCDYRDEDNLIRMDKKLPPPPLPPPPIIPPRSLPFSA